MRGNRAERSVHIEIDTIDDEFPVRVGFVILVGRRVGLETEYILSVCRWLGIEVGGDAIRGPSARRFNEYRKRSGSRVLVEVQRIGYIEIEIDGSSYP